MSIVLIFAEINIVVNVRTLLLKSFEFETVGEKLFCLRSWHTIVFVLSTVQPYLSWMSRVHFFDLRYLKMLKISNKGEKDEERYIYVYIK